MKKLIRKSINKLGYDVIKADNRRYADFDKDFWDIYIRCKDYTMVPIERMYSLYKAIEYVIDTKIDGDFVECGVWKGGCSMIIALTLLKKGVNDRKIYLYDTYTGMSEPTKEDINIFSKKQISDKWKNMQKKEYNNWCYSSLDDVKKNIQSTNYLEENIIFVKGKVEDSIPKTIPTKISLLRLDTDWYESTKHEMIHLFPILINKGIIIIDDYGCWAGSRKAVDEYLKNNQINILLNRTDNLGGRIGIKI